MQQALRHRADFAEAQFNLGLALERQGKLAEAEARFQQAVRLKPDHAEAHFQLRLILERQGKH